MASSDADASQDEARDHGGSQEVRDHGGLVDITRLPGGGYIGGIRSELVARYEGYLELDESDTEPIKRWGLGSIISHWLLVVLMVIAIVTGVAFWTGWYGPMDIGIWDGYQTAFYLHIAAGILIAVIALVVFPFYHKFADGHHLVVSLDQIKEEIVIALSFVGLVRYIPGYKKARRTYDEDDGEWAAYHPMQTVFWYVTWFFVLVLTLTGFALWRELSTDPAWWITALGFMEGWVAYETMLQLHLIATFWIIAAIAIHAYFPLMRGNWDVLRSMIDGTLEGWRVDAETRPESSEGADKDGATSQQDGDRQDDD